MALDQSKLGIVAAQLMEQLEQTYGDEASLGTVAVIAEVDHGDQNTIHYAFSESTPKHVGVGLLVTATDAIRARHG